MSEHSDLTGAILTPTQREYLQGDGEDRSGASERMTRSRIRQRIAAGVYDFSTILQHLPHRDLDTAFTNRLHLGQGVTVDPKKMIPDAIGVLYLGSIARDAHLGHTGLEPARTDDGYYSSPLDKPAAFRRRIESGIEQALTRRGIAVTDVSVTIEIEVDGEIQEPTDDLVNVTPEKLEQLRLAGAIRHDEYRGAIARQAGLDPEDLLVDSE